MALAVIVRAEQRLNAALTVDSYLGRLEEAHAGAHRAGESGRRDAGGFDEARDADAAQTPGRFRRRPASRETVMPRACERAFQDSREVAAIVGRSDRRGVGHRIAGDQVAAADLDRIEAGGGGRAVGQPLEDEARLGPPRAAIGVGRHRVGEDAGHLDIDRRRAVNAGEQRRVDRARDRRAEGREIGPQIGHGFDPEPEEPAVLVERELGPGAMVARLGVGDEGLAARADPPDGPAEAARRPADRDLFRIVLALVAEPAADIGGDHPDLAVGHAELGRHRPPHQMHRLGGVVERDRFGDRVVGRHRGARLKRGAGDAVVVDVDPDGARGRFHRAVDRRLVAAAPDVADISRRLVVQHDFGADGLARADHGGQRPVANPDQLGRVVGRGLRLRQHRRDRFADMPDPVPSERPARRLRHRRPVLGRDLPEARHRPDAVSRHVGAGEHRRDAGNGARRGGLDVRQLRVGVIRSDETAMERAGDDTIRHVLPHAGQKPPVLQAQNRRADARIGCHRPISPFTPARRASDRGSRAPAGR